MEYGNSFYKVLFPFPHPTQYTHTQPAPTPIPHPILPSPVPQLILMQALVFVYFTKYMQVATWSKERGGELHPREKKKFFALSVAVSKGPYSSERFNKLTYGINKITKCGTWQAVKFQLISRFWNEMIFISYLWINVANINSETR